MKFDRGGNAHGVQFRIGLRSVVHYYLARVFLRTTAQCLVAPAAGGDLRRIGHHELHRISVGSLNDKARSLAQTVQPLKCALHAGPLIDRRFVPGFWFGRRCAVGVHLLARRIFGGVDRGFTLVLYALKVGFPFVFETLPLRRIVIELLFLYLQTNLTNAFALFISSRSSLRARPRFLSLREILRGDIVLRQRCPIINATRGPGRRLSSEVRRAFQDFLCRWPG